jgi:L-alanine-DL-glutamate epimerase-like enolase superfamily enzyme
MKITDVTLTLFAWDDIPATRYSANTGRFQGSSDLGLLTITTDQGVEGHAFLGSAWSPASLDAPKLMRYLKPLIMGKDPLERERLYQALWSRSRTASIPAIGAIDVALWDIAGKTAGMPIHRLLGSYRSIAPAYASSQVHDHVEEYVTQALHFKERGWPAYKIHPPQTSWQDDVAVCRAVRRAVGEDYRLMLDAAWSYEYETALRVGRAIEELGFYWYEDPLAHQDIYNYVKLRQKLDIPIMATEAPAAGLDSYTAWLTERATDFLRGDVAVKGGITTLVKTAHLAEAFHMKYEIHHGGNSLNNLANLHVMMAIKNSEYFEVLLPDGAQKYGLERDIEVDGQGFVHAPTEPGLGATLDRKLIERNKIAVLS